MENNQLGAVVYNGQHKNDDGWDYFRWLYSLNGVCFEYFTGIGHATNKRQKNGWNSNKKPNQPVISDNAKWIHVPKTDDILNCLFLDSQAINDSFYHWADDFGYDRDSIKALDIYNSCQKTAIKLQKALGKNYQSEKKRIEDLEL